jgi:hypothetical protein
VRALRHLHGSQNSLLGVQKFPAPLRREFRLKPLISLVKYRVGIGTRKPESAKFPANSLLAGNLQVGDRFAYDCAHHQPSLAKRLRLPRRSPQGEGGPCASYGSASRPQIFQIGPCRNVSWQAPGFDFPDQFQHRLGEAAAGGIERKDRSETVAAA